MQAWPPENSCWIFVLVIVIPIWPYIGVSCISLMIDCLKVCLLGTLRCLFAVQFFAVPQSIPVSAEACPPPQEDLAPQNLHTFALQALASGCTSACLMCLTNQGSCFATCNHHEQRGCEHAGWVAT